MRESTLLYLLTYDQDPKYDAGAARAENSHERPTLCLADIEMTAFEIVNNGENVRNVERYEWTWLTKGGVEIFKRLVDVHGPATLCHSGLESSYKTILQSQPGNNLLLPLSGIRLSEEGTLAQ